MIKKVIAKIWRNIPTALRSKIIRTTQKKFTVSVAAIIINAEKKVLLLEHLLRPQASGWGIPGGFIEQNEQPIEAIRREIREETGIELENLRMIRVRTIHCHVEILFRAESFDKAEVRSPEIISVGWFTVDEIPPAMNDVQKSIIEKVLQGEI